MKVEDTEASLIKRVVIGEWPVSHVETQGSNTFRIFWSDGRSDCYNPAVFGQIAEAFQLLASEGHLIRGPRPD